MTRPYAEVIGDPIAHSKSPLIHNFWLQKLGIDAEYRACHVRAEELKEYFTQRREDAKWLGCNVTIPHKETALNQVDDARLPPGLAAANTIVVHNGSLHAFNTDVIGILEPLSHHPLPPDYGQSEDLTVAEVAIAHIIGAGGAAKAAVEAAMEAEYRCLEIYNRSIERGRETAAAMGLPRSQVFGLDALQKGPMPADHPFHGYEARYLVINASPMGMGGKNPVPVDLDDYPSTTIVFDMVYTPNETPLIAEAHRLGLVAIDGLQMLVAQAAAAFQLLFGEPAPREHDAELRELLTA